MSDYADDYDRYDAEADAAHDAYERELREILDPMVRAEVAKRVAKLEEDPAVEDIDEDAILEQVEEELRPEAEEILRESDPPEPINWSPP
jgi:hypothetical protein